MIRNFLLLPLIAAISLLAASGCQTSRSYPLVYHYGSPWTEASVNGVSGLYLLDTGASISVIDEDIARRARLRPYGEQEILGTTSSIMMRQGWADTVELAGYRHRDRLLVIQDLSAFRAPGGRRQAGLLGCDHFMDYTIVFDVENARFQMTKRPAPLARGMTSYPITMKSGVPMIPIFFPPDPVPQMAQLDSGSAFADEGIVHLDMARQAAERILGDRLLHPPDETSIVMSISGRETLPVYYHGPIRVLGHTFPEARVVVRSPATDGAFADQEAILITGSIIGLLGRVEIDFPRRSIWIPRQ